MIYENFDAYSDMLVLEDGETSSTFKFRSDYCLEIVKMLLAMFSL